MARLSFSGHESFQCRNLWLKKGYDYTQSGGDFRDDLAVVNLGVGKNMVTAIKYWLRSFNLVDEDGQLNEISNLILHDDGKDPFLEDIGSLWLLHYKLVTTNKASVFNLFFNHFRKKRIEFSKEYFLNFLTTECNLRNENHSENTLETDFGVLLKTYVRPSSKNDYSDIEDSFSSLLIDLELIKPVFNRKDWYECRNEERTSLPTEIVFYSILSNPKFSTSKSISFNHLLNDENSPGVVFALDADSLLKYVLAISKKYNGISFKDDAGIRVMQIKKNYSPLSVLEEYYEE